MEDTLLTLLGYYLKLYLIAIIVVIVVVAIAALFTGIGVTWQTWQIPLANYYYYCYCCCIFRNLSFFLSPLPSYTFFLLYHICASVYLLNASSLPRCFISLLVNKTLLPTTHHKIPLNFNLFFLSIFISLFLLLITLSMSWFLLFSKLFQQPLKISIHPASDERIIVLDIIDKN